MQRNKQMKMDALTSALDAGGGMDAPVPMDPMAGMEPAAMGTTGGVDVAPDGTVTAGGQTIGKVELVFVPATDATPPATPDAGSGASPTY